MCYPSCASSPQGVGFEPAGYVNPFEIKGEPLPPSSNDARCPEIKACSTLVARSFFADLSRHLQPRYLSQLVLHPLTLGAVIGACATMLVFMPPLSVFLMLGCYGIAYQVCYVSSRRLTVTPIPSASIKQSVEQLKRHLQRIANNEGREPQQLLASLKREYCSSEDILDFINFLEKILLDTVEEVDGKLTMQQSMDELSQLSQLVKKNLEENNKNPYILEILKGIEQKQKWIIRFLNRVEK